MLRRLIEVMTLPPASVLLLFLIGTALRRKRPKTGRTHQIQVHMAHIKYPLLGDPVYGGRLSIPKGVSSDLEQVIRAFKRQALHAYRLSFAHPVSGAWLSFEAELPQDMQHVLDVLRQDVNASSEG